MALNILIYIGGVDVQIAQKLILIIVASYIEKITA
jgi:hypothetical protein